MPRNDKFTPDREPFRTLQFCVSGPLSALNPTRANFERIPSSVPLHGDDENNTLQGGTADVDKQVAPGYGYQWRSRDNRKGRHALLLQKPTKEERHLVTPRTSSPRQVLRGFQRMLTSYPYWDISYLVAILFTFGSVVWVINGFFAYLPLVQPASEFPHELSIGTGVTAFVGATIFELGSVLLLLEAVNARNEGCFGWAVEQIWADGVDATWGVRLKPDPQGCRHRHRHRKEGNLWRRLTGRNPKAATESFSPPAGSPLEKGPTGRDEDGERLSWCWFPSWHDLQTHYLREIGFLASLIQFISATIFWISGFTALPGVVNMDKVGLVNGVFWTPQVIGGTGFIISGALFLLETQPKWWIPAPMVLGWHVGFWNLIGGIGFTLCGALGFAISNSKVAYQSTLATFWGSWAFLIGSTVQWYESLSKYPVEFTKAK